MVQVHNLFYRETDTQSNNEIDTIIFFTFNSQKHLDYEITTKKKDNWKCNAQSSIEHTS